jgi:hypothetical protein
MVIDLAPWSDSPFKAMLKTRLCTVVEVEVIDGVDGGDGGDDPAVITSVPGT